MINSRKKGHSFERENVKEFRVVYPDCERSQEGSPEDRHGIDLRGTGDLRVQCKRGKNYAPISKIEEVKTTNGKRVLVTKGDRKPPVVVIDRDFFIELLSIRKKYNETIALQKPIGRGNHLLH